MENYLDYLVDLYKLVDVKYLKRQITIEQLYKYYDKLDEWHDNYYSKLEEEPK